MSDLGNKAIMSNNIRYYMSVFNKDRNDICEDLGFKYSTFTDWVNGNKYPRIDKIEMMANYFGISKSNLVEEHKNIKSDNTANIPTGFQPCPPTVKRPLVGRIACGEPILAEQNIEDMVEVPTGRGIDFCLTCVGESMIDAGIEDGDIIYIHQQPTVENGAIAAVRIGDEATLKRVYMEKDSIMLMPANPAYAPKTFYKEEMNNVQIEGLAVGFSHWF